MVFSRIQSSSLVPVLIGATIGAIFPFIAAFAFAALEHSAFQLVTIFLGAPLWALFRGLLWLCPSTRDGSGLGASNECVFTMIPVVWLLSVLLGAGIGMVIVYGQTCVQKRSMKG